MYKTRNVITVYYLICLLRQCPEVNEFLYKPVVPQQSSLISTSPVQKVGKPIKMKSAVFALAGLVFALGMAGTLGYGYESYAGYSGPTGFTGYGQKGQLETTQYIPYAVPVPSPVAAPAYGAVGGASTGGLFGDDGLLFLIPLLLILFANNNNSG